MTGADGAPNYPCMIGRERGRGCGFSEGSSTKLRREVELGSSFDICICPAQPPSLSLLLYSRQIYFYWFSLSCGPAKL